jgi:hypothetical protein
MAIAGQQRNTVGKVAKASVVATVLHSAVTITVLHSAVASADAGLRVVVLSAPTTCVVASMAIVGPHRTTVETVAKASVLKKCTDH